MRPCVKSWFSSYTQQQRARIAKNAASLRRIDYIFKMKDLERFSGKTTQKARPEAAQSSPQTVLPQAQFVTIGEEEAGQRIDNYLLRICKGVPKSHVYRILRSGEVRVNKGRIDQLYRLAEGDMVTVTVRL